ncbi:MAG: hypothetical protein ACRYGG_19560 [Janthinobacterium lividum]
MPPYDPSPFAPPPVLLQPNKVEYLLGRRTANQADTRLTLQSVTDDGTSATFTGQVTEGNIPIVGSMLSTQPSDPNYAVINSPISAVNFTANGFGTVKVPSVHAGSEALSGLGLIPVPEVPETLVNGYSIPCIVPTKGESAISRKLMVQIGFPTVPTACTVTLQRAMRNYPNDYTDLETVATVAGGVVTQSVAYFDGEGVYYRFSVTGLVGVGSIVAKLIT